MTQWSVRSARFPYRVLGAVDALSPAAALIRAREKHGYAVTVTEIARRDGAVVDDESVSSAPFAFDSPSLGDSPSIDTSSTDTGTSSDSTGFDGFGGGGDTSGGGGGSDF